MTIVEHLRLDNPAAKAVDLRIVADALLLYMQASANIAENGAICANPKTGAPIDNPYLRVRDQAAKTIERHKRIKSDRVLGML